MATPDHTYPQLVQHDAYDLAAWNRALERMPGLRPLLQAGARLHPGFAALGQDLFCTFFKYTYQQTPLPPSQQGRLALATRALNWVRSANDFARLRAETVLDEDRSAFATLQVLTSLERTLRKPSLFSPEELLENFALHDAEQHLEHLQDQLQAAQTMLDAQDTPPEGLQEATHTLHQEALQQALQIKALRQRAEQSLDGLPASIKTDLRNLTNALPERMEQGEQAIEEFTSQMGVDQHGDAASRLALGQRLLGLDKLHKLAQLVGAMRHFARAQRQAVMERTGTEVHAIDRGRDLSRLLPSEVVSLRHPQRRKDFLRRYQEGDLLQYALEGKDRGARGPMIVCVDGSGSMQGDKELWAKGVCLSLMEIARRQRRHFRAIVFSGGQRELRVFDLLLMPGPGQLQAPPVDLEHLMDFADYFPRGGTDFQGPLDRALELLQHKNLQRGDIVLITDGEANLHPNWKTEFLQEKQRLGFTLYGVLVDVGPGSGSLRPGPLLQIADRITSVTRLQAREVKDLFLSL